jgi:hypothetical protein
MAGVSSDELTALVKRLSAVLETQKLEIEAIKAELQVLRENRTKLIEPALPEEQLDGEALLQAADVETHSNFSATGPGTGFLAEAGGNDGMDRGVVGIGSKAFFNNIAGTIGVLGFTSTLDLTLANGKGVVGRTDGGIAVQGLNIGVGADGTGVQGISAGRGTGVQGSSDSGVGVAGTSSAIGILGFGATIGVQGSSSQTGVLGGPPLGRTFAPGNSFGIGVLGVAIGDVRVGDFPFSYGGWLDGLNGTAPIHLEPSGSPTPPTAAQRGDLFVDSNGGLWFCTDTGNNDPSPATWRTVQLT